MLEASRRRIETELPGEAVVLDVGGWAKPLGRADWVLDLLPYETRGQSSEAPSEIDPSAERFSAETWVTRDICDHEPWPFADGQFDFAVCAHTLEDVRDPIWVCSELNRVARAGYLEVPSRVAEQSHGVQGPWAGWSHHRWLVDLGEDPPSASFVFKYHVLDGAERYQVRGRYWSLSEEERVQSLWWDGAFAYEERIFMDSSDLDAYLVEMPRAYPPPAGRLRGLLSRTRQN